MSAASKAAKRRYAERHKERVRESKARWNKENRETRHAQQRRWRAVHPDKHCAHATVANALKTGSLCKEPCAICKRTDVEAHHEDYSKPLDVIWLCRSCHKQHHRKQKEVQYG